MLSLVTLLRMESLAVTHRHQWPGPSIVKSVTAFLIGETVLLTYFQKGMSFEQLKLAWGGDRSNFLPWSPFNKALL